MQSSIISHMGFAHTNTHKISNHWQQWNGFSLLDSTVLSQTGNLPVHQQTWLNKQREWDGWRKNTYILTCWYNGAVKCAWLQSPSSRKAVSNLSVVTGRIWAGRMSLSLPQPQHSSSCASALWAHLSSITNPSLSSSSSISRCKGSSAIGSVVVYTYFSYVLQFTSLCSVFLFNIWIRSCINQQNCVRAENSIHLQCIMQYGSKY